MADAQFTDIKACVFDAYGTLFNVHAPTAHAAASLAGKADELSRLWRQKQLEYTWLRSMMRAHIDFWELTGTALDYALDALDLTDRDLRDRLMQLYLELDAYPDVKPALEALRAKGLKTAILSNGSPKMLAAAAKSAGIADVLDAVLSIEDVGIYKPDPKVYQMTLDHFDIQAPQVCFVSTNAWDASAGAHFGYTVAWMNRFGMVRERLPGEPKAIIKGLDELPGLIGD